MLSKKAKYALIASLHLARRVGEGPISIGDLATREGIPRKFLELILLELKNRGILHSQKGKAGGYSLGRTPAEISVGEIVRVIEGPVALLPCVSVTAYRRCEECRDEKLCGIRMIFQEVRDATATLLDGATLADLLDRENEARLLEPDALTYQI